MTESNEPTVLGSFSDRPSVLHHDIPQMLFDDKKHQHSGRILDQCSKRLAITLEVWNGDETSKYANRTGLPGHVRMWHVLITALWISKTNAD
ncbi:hypothetical protein EAF00_010231 [Botryotinia globosa]|nr:hypothetical protein EAF00_010231 [Botryotinia globosa]